MEYVSVREGMGFPLIALEKKKHPPKILAIKPSGRFSPKKSENFLLEIGSEQLPATFVPIGSAQLEKGISKLLTDHKLPFGKIQVFGTPRRLAVLVTDLAEGTAPCKIEKKGPPISTAFDMHGKPTEQGKGFLKSIGHKVVDLLDIRKNKIPSLRIQFIKEIEYLFGTIEEAGVSTACILAEALPKLITSLDFPKKMRWGDLDITYARPIHWIVALFGTKVVPFQLAHIRSDRISEGHAQLNPKKFPLKNAKEYAAVLKKHSVIASIEERKKAIKRQLRAIERRVKGRVLEEERVLSQVLHLTEWPQLTHAEFDPLYLKAPQEILILEMIEHQKYFPVADASGSLKNLFIITADNKPNALIRKGNQKVLSARLADGVFLYNLDLQTSLESFNKKLKEMTYQKELGSMMDKVERIGAISCIVREELHLGEGKKVARSALLCKADLASSLVSEFPELQGTIGRYYALAQKEDPEVGISIQEHWMPRSENGSLPQTPTGIVVSIADKFDNLIGSYSIGFKPSSSSDPYALRRQTIGIIKILIAQKISSNLKKILERSAPLFPSLTVDAAKQKALTFEILQFITARAKGVFEDFGFKKDEIEASFQTLLIDPYDQFCKTQALHNFRKTQDFPQLFEVYKRAKGQLQKTSSVAFDPSLAQERAEILLTDALHEIDRSWERVLANRNYHLAFQLVAKLQKPLADLFDKVKILCDDPKIQQNRIAL
ncbi:MAG: glycine--tRNA ligase subunit beta, partial [Chlamydiales bacterium]|nr:glycine--tRNA ligase subunit beta [Chlamydiales bacterium]